MKKPLIWYHLHLFIFILLQSESSKVSTGFDIPGQYFFILMVGNLCSCLHFLTFPSYQSFIFHLKLCVFFPLMHILVYLHAYQEPYKIKSLSYFPQQMFFLFYFSPTSKFHLESIPLQVLLNLLLEPWNAWDFCKYHLKLNLWHVLFHYTCIHISELS